MSRELLKCDLDGVPFIVQKFVKFLNVYEEEEYIGIKIFSGVWISITEAEISLKYSPKLWESVSDIELYEILENYMSINYKSFLR